MKNQSNSRVYWTTRHRLAIIVLGTLLLSGILLVPGYFSYLTNQQRIDAVSEYSSVVHFSTICHAESGIHYCNETEFKHYLPDLRLGDHILLTFQFLPNIVTTHTNDGPFFTPRISIYRYSPFVADKILYVASDSYEYEVRKAGNYTLLFQLNPMAYHESEFESFDVDLEIQMDIEINPNQQELPLVTKISWLPLTLILLVIIVTYLKRKIH